MSDDNPFMPQGDDQAPVPSAQYQTQPGQPYGANPYGAPGQVPQYQQPTQPAASERQHTSASQPAAPAYGQVPQYGQIPQYGKPSQPRDAAQSTTSVRAGYAAPAVPRYGDPIEQSAQPANTAPVNPSQGNPSQGNPPHDNPSQAIQPSSATGSQPQVPVYGEPQPAAKATTAVSEATPAAATATAASVAAADSQPQPTRPQPEYGQNAPSYNPAASQATASQATAAQATAAQPPYTPGAAPAGATPLPQGMPQFDQYGQPSIPYGVLGEPPIDKPWYGIGFGAAIARFFRKYATFTGRASKGEFWWPFLLFVIVNVVTGIVTMVSFWVGEALSTVWLLAVIVPFTSAGVRRLHDTGRKGSWMLLPGIPFILTQLISYGWLYYMFKLAAKLKPWFEAGGQGTIQLSEQESAAVLLPLLAIVVTGLLYIISLIALMVGASHPSGAQFDAAPGQSNTAPQTPGNAAYGAAYAAGASAYGPAYGGAYGAQSMPQTQPQPQQPQQQAAPQQPEYGQYAGAPVPSVSAGAPVPPDQRSDNRISR
ncbi:DUF805 domain-containing protein [Bifidobacterium jacchi]|uniref:DUF805 domain-containing protein n=1 Tax=Bifidobacterium jacchi TaxID=2490545 RepID=A0A5N5RH08_9BIFI|nr:DUF805 domain-containing protein [Bifidobacterium jacchi]KAB5606031.1 DUF805 domain-containing protein [Bifidobacterium jacchi]